MFQQHQAALQVLFDAYLSATVDYVRKNLHEPVPTVNSNLVRSLLNVLDSMFQQFLPSADGEAPPDTLPAFVNVLGHIFIFSLVWSVGATVDQEGRVKFDAFLRGKIRASGNNSYAPPEKGTVYDYCFDVKTGAWYGWMDTIPPFTVDISLPYNQIIVPTIDSVRYRFMLDLLLKNGKHVLCVGPTGTGKSVTILETLLHGMPSKYSSVVLNFSAQTSANQTQDILDSKMDKRRKGVYGPAPGRKVLSLLLGNSYSIFYK